MTKTALIAGVTGQDGAYLAQLLLGAMENHKTPPKFSAEVRERAVRMVFEHRTEHASQWEAIVSIGPRLAAQRTSSISLSMGLI